MQSRVVDQEWARELEQGVVEYTDNLIENALFSDEETEAMPTLSGEVFCGCDTCFWREALFFLVPRIIDGYKNGKVTIDEE